MTFVESASLIGSQVLTNWLVSSDIQKNMYSPSAATALLALMSLIFIAREWRESPTTTFKDYRISVNTHIFFGKHTHIFLLIFKLQKGWLLENWIFCIAWGTEMLPQEWVYVHGSNDNENWINSVYN